MKGKIHFFGFLLLLEFSQIPQFCLRVVSDSSVRRASNTYLINSIQSVIVFGRVFKLRSLHGWVFSLGEWSTL